MSATGCGSGVAAQPAGYSQRHAPASQLATLDEPLAPVAPPLPSAAMAPFRQSQTAAPPLPAPSEGTSKLLLVVVISGGSPPGAPSMSLKCSDAGVSSRGHDQAVLASLPALTHAQKLSAPGSADFPSDAAVYDLSALITAGIDSWQLKLDPPPAEPHRVTGYLLDATWRPTCAAWTCPMAAGATNGSFERPVRFEGAAARWFYSEYHTPPPQLRRGGDVPLISALSKSERTSRLSMLSLTSPSSQKQIRFGSPVKMHSRTSPMIAKAVAVRPPAAARYRLPPTSVPAPDAQGKEIQHRLSQFVPIMPRKSGQVDASRAYARKQHKMMIAAKGTAPPSAAPRMPPAPRVQVCAPTQRKLAAVAGAHLYTSDLATASYALLADMARSGSSCATIDSGADSVCPGSMNLSSSADDDHNDLLSAIEGLSSGDIEYEMMDAHLDELMQYVQ